MGQEQHAALFAPPTADPDGRPNLIGMDRQQLAETLAGMGAEPFRVKQVWQWIYNRGATDFDAMTSLAKRFRADLAERFSLVRPQIARGQHAADGTQKWLLRFGDGNQAETVYIPETGRGTLCVSSQIGCTLTCRFCLTGTQRLVRNLAPAELVGQVLLARDELGEWPSPRDGRMLSNIVMMGMGEPLYNFDNVARALHIVMDNEGIALSRRRITLSTAGVVPMMQRCGEVLGVNLAVSLHAVTDEIRDEIVPLNRKYPIADLIRACRAYPGASNARRITFEYVMLRYVNDSPADAKALVRLIRGIPAKVNLIPFNPWPGAPYERSTDAAIDRFAKIVLDAGYASPVRTPRGEDIMAACGQLKSASIRQARRACDATDPPATNPPATDPPATNSPATNPPATDPPATNSPATNPPATNPPATNPPATNPPATNPPATNSPATNPPATNLPATNLAGEPAAIEPFPWQRQRPGP